MDDFLTLIQGIVDAVRKEFATIVVDQASPDTSKYWRSQTRHRAKAPSLAFPESRQIAQTFLRAMNSASDEAVAH